MKRFRTYDDRWLTFMKHIIDSIKIMLLAGLIFISNLVCGQDELPSMDYTPASPTAQTFMRYGEIPVDYSTGVPNIEIPIYTLEGRRLKLPISISYHASGIKVNDVASEIGLGWALNAQGIVSRSINGKRDDLRDPIRTFSNANHLHDSLVAASSIYENNTLYGLLSFDNFFNNIFNNVEDGMSDRYFYRLPNGVSGVFTYDYDDVTGEIDSVITLPYRPYNIERFTDNESSDAIAFRITDDNGIVYTFRSYHLCVSCSWSDWFLEEMVTADGTDAIKFYYTRQTAKYSFSGPHFVYQSRPTGAINCTPVNNQSSLSYSASPLQDFSTPVLDSIVSSKAIVRFQYADREDFDILKRLTEITIAAQGEPNTILKNIVFTPKYFGSVEDNNIRLGLDNVVISSPGDPEPQEYTFTYEDQVLPTYAFKDPPAFSEDFWGYYNGKNNSSQVPADFITNVHDKQAYGANRYPDPTGYYSRACMLREIKYPTGGRTFFEFERNYAKNVYPDKVSQADKDGYVGGFRVAAITNYNENNEVVNVKSYEYMHPEVKPVSFPYFNYTHTFHENASVCVDFFSSEYVVSNPLLPLEVAPGLPVMYREVVEYNGTKASNAGKTVYTYNEPYSPADLDQYPDRHPMELHPYHDDKGNYRPELISKKVYSFDGASYHPVSRERYGYTKHYTKTFDTGIKLTRRRTYKDPTVFGQLCGTHPSFNCNPFIQGFINSTIVLDAKAYQEASLLTTSEKYTYDPLDSTKYVLETTYYSYNEHNLAVGQKVTTTSKGDTLKTTYKYPYDFGETEPYQTMLDKRVYSPVVEQSTSKANDELLSRTKINYKNWGDNIIEPEHVEVQTGPDGPLEERVNYLSYDAHGNVTGVQKADDMPIVYLWGYDQNYPIAKVENARMINIDQQWSGYFNYEGDMASNQAYVLNGSVNFPQGVAATITRYYYKLDDHRAVFTGKVYDANHSLVYSFTDEMDEGQTTLNASAQTSLPAGEYTVEVSASYPGSPIGQSYPHEILVGMSGAVSFPFYTSFEDENDQVSYTYSKTGTRSHTGTYSVKVPTSSSGYDQVVISYWGKANGSSPWSYVEEVVNTTGHVATQTIGAGYQYIDEVRVYPVGAMMTTYTYEPLRGVSSVSDPAGTTTYYEYDEMGRLNCIKDHEKNIVKTYKYHFRR